MFCKVETSAFYAVHESTVAETKQKPLSRTTSDNESKLESAARPPSQIKTISISKSISNYNLFSPINTESDGLLSTSEDELINLISRESSPASQSPVFGPEPSDKELVGTINAFINLTNQKGSAQGKYSVMRHLNNSPLIVTPPLYSTPVVALDSFEIKDRVHSIIG